MTDGILLAAGIVGVVVVLIILGFTLAFVGTWLKAKLNGAPVNVEKLILSA